MRNKRLNRFFLGCLFLRVDSAVAETEDDFPTPESLRAANSSYKQKVVAKGEDGRVLPSPAVRTKQQIFTVSDYEAIDDRARQVRTYTYMRIQ